MSKTDVVIEVLLEFLSPTTAVGNTTYDNKAYDNLKSICYIHDYCYDLIKDNAELQGNEYSVQRSREYAIKHLKESIENMTDLLKDLEGSEVVICGVKEPCNDAISRQAVLDATVKKNSVWNNITNAKGENLEKIISQLPPVNPQETVTEFADRCRECGKMKRCKDCRYFEYNSVAKVDGIPLIVAHEICSKWGDGCKTSEDGYCFLFESKEGSEE